ncbi:MAG: hypothetical protein M0P11_06925 [Anaerolineaceae bacterium]|nr:hypothetical protein [Anaerolineaceae bacterium]
MSKSYRVLSPISVGGVITKSGTVELDDAMAKRFLAMSQPPIADPDQPPQSEGSDADEKSGATAGAGTGGAEGVTQAQIVDAIGKLEPGNDKQWTKGNLPDANYLSDVLNHKISAAERDEAWKAFQAARDGN